MKDEIKEISKADKKLLDKIEHILASELSCKEYDSFYDYFNEIRKPNIIIDIKDDENIKDYITNLQTIEQQYSAILSENAELENKITNLQEENEKSFEKGYAEGIIVAELDNENEFIVAYKELKQRIDKAIEYINQNKHLSMFADCREPEEEWNYDLEINPRELLNILKGSDEELLEEIE